jgi:Protein of unknown function
MIALSHQDIDGLILSFAKVQWRKVAMIISQVLSECRRRGVDVDEDGIAERICNGVAERICALVEDGQLEAQGDLSRWRHSEVKLPD